MLGLPQCGWVQTVAVHGERTRHERVPATGEARVGEVRGLSHPGGPGHTLQNQICQVHGLPQGRAPGTVRRSAVFQSVREVSHAERIQPINLHIGAPQELALYFDREPRRNGMQRMSQGEESARTEGGRLPL